MKDHTRPVCTKIAQCSATLASVAATPPCSATPLQRQLDETSLAVEGRQVRQGFLGGV